MLDINFYRKFDDVLDDIKKGKIQTREDCGKALKSIMSDHPVVYNIETTNRCNMRCKMCPRTTMMTRKIEDIDRETFFKCCGSNSATFKRRLGIMENLL